MKIIVTPWDMVDKSYQEKWRRGLPLSLDDFYLSAHNIKTADTIMFEVGDYQVKLK